MINLPTMYYLIAWKNILYTTSTVPIFSSDTIKLCLQETTSISIKIVNINIIHFYGQVKLNYRID